MGRVSSVCEIVKGVFFLMLRKMILMEGGKRYMKRLERFWLEFLRMVLLLKIMLSDEAVRR